ncbi:SOCS box domain-containing protein [Trichonephila inaurata madagascariensis]|uniref:SOCS box domain-containing protein n=1 Tax=Trichonephila inaurata madagascariensis TaxID=2747483 RepID=A0A8X6ME99_9ARAC|nr:SOCS box domain-containing protein [Trichonephila inaurata madagascariensis]
MNNEDCTVCEQDKTDEFLSLFSNLSKLNAIDSSKGSTTKIEESIFHFLHFYERHKHNIDRKHIRKIIFSELPNICFVNHVENSIVVAEVLHSINELTPIGTPNIVLFLVILCLAYKALPLETIIKRNEMRKASFTALTYFLHYAFKQRLLFQNRKPTEMITYTNPLLFSKLLFFSESKNLLSLLQFGLRFEFSGKFPFRIHPIFLCASELIRWFIEDGRCWNAEHPQENPRQTDHEEKLSTFCKNFKIILLSTSNPHKIKSEMTNILMKNSDFAYFAELKPYLDTFFPDVDFQSYQPPNLQYICRNVIRKRLDERWCLPYGVWKLPLPRMLQSYLNFGVDEKGNEII